MDNVKGFHVCKAGNAPVVGQTKTFLVNGDRIKSKSAQDGGQSYTIVSVTPRESYKDAYGNLGYDLEIEPQKGTDMPQDAPQQTVRPFPSDDRSQRIERQHSQHMAILTVGILVSNGMISTPEEMKTKLKELTDYYQRDVSRQPGSEEF